MLFLPFRHALDTRGSMVSLGNCFPNTTDLYRKFYLVGCKMKRKKPHRDAALELVRWLSGLGA